MTLIVPPLNFSLVFCKVYRSGCPNKKNHEFLKRLSLKSVLYVCEDDYRQENVDFFKEQGIQVFQIRTSGNKEPFVEIDQEDIAQALSIILNQENHPILVHCNKGKHRVGVVIGCLRKVQGWSIAAIFDEYKRFSGQKLRIADQEFIEVFDETVLG